MNVVAPRPMPRMTTAEFLDWEPGDGRCWQLVDGVPEPMAPTVRTHAMLQNEIGRLLGNHLVEHGIDASVGANPGIQPRVRARANVRIPDLAVVRGSYAAEERLLTDPLIAIEVLSESNEDETMRNVWSYTSIPSLLEIVIFRTDRIEAELLRRADDGAWPADPVPLGAGDALELASIGFRAPLAAFYRTTRLA